MRPSGGVNSAGMSLVKGQARVSEHADLAQNYLEARRSSDGGAGESAGGSVRMKP